MEIAKTTTTTLPPKDREGISAEAETLIRSSLFADDTDLNSLVNDVIGNKDPENREMAIGWMMAFIRSKRLSIDEVKRIIERQTYNGTSDKETAEMLAKMQIKALAGKSYQSQEDFIEFIQKSFPHLMPDLFEANPAWKLNELRNYFKKNWANRSTLQTFAQMTPTFTTRK